MEKKYMNYYLIHYIGNVEYKRFKFEQLRSFVCKELDIKEEVIGKRTRKREIVVARQILMQLMFDFIRPTLTLSGIGRLIGNFDHSIVLHAFKMVKDIKQINLVYLQLKAKIENGSI